MTTESRTGISRAILALLLCLTLPLIACDRGENAEDAAADAQKDDAEKKDKKKDELVPVEVVALEKGPIEAVLRFSTNLEAESAVQVFSQASRLVTQLLVEEGDKVRKGQVLLRLQSEEQTSQLERVKSQLDKAHREYERQKSLFARELISEQTFNDATYEMEQLELSVADAERELSYTEVRAPISGIVTQRLVNLGDFITVNEHLFDMVDFETIVARIYVPEKEIGRLNVGQSTRLFSDSLGGGARSGEVVRVAPIVDSRSGTIKVTVSVPPSEGLLPGMYVEVELVTDTREDALRIPKPAVTYDNQQAYIFRLRDEMTVERMSLVPRLADEFFIEPAQGSGLEEGHRVVVAGQAGLKNGAKVRIAGEPIPEEPEEFISEEEADSEESTPDAEVTGETDKVEETDAAESES